MKPRLMKRLTWSDIFTLIAVLLIQNAVGQSNYASHADNINYVGEGLPGEATLDGKVTKLDELRPIIFLNRTRAALNCAAGSMQIEMKFTEPFFGLAYADFDRNSACQTLGKGETSARLELPLKGCGTKQEPQRVFTNNIVVRFHPGLEMDGDEIITIVCRYPPPIAPLPAAPPVPRRVDKSAVGAPLKGTQLLFIVCAIMFLTLLLLGLGVSYYCLSRRTIPVVRRLPISIGSGSEITKLSSSTYGQVPPLEGLKVPHIIPRAHAIVGAVPSTSSSDDNPLIPSDYPSESHSEVEIDTRSLPASSGGSYDNQAYIQDNSSIYSEHYGHTQEFQAANAIAQQSLVSRLPIAVKEPSPTFDVQVRVKRPAPQAPLSSFSSDTESLGTSVLDRNNLSTIMESHEDRESVITIDSLPRDVAHSHFTYVPELHAAPKYVEQPPITTTVTKSYKEQTEEHWAEDYPDSVPPRSIPETRSIVSTDTRHDIHSISEMVDTSHLYQHQPYETTMLPNEQVERLPEPPIVARKPEITSHLVDDVFLRTITEKTTIEDIEKYKRMVTEYKAKPAPTPPTWDVTIRNYPTTQDKPTWEDFSDISSAPSVQVEPIKYKQPPQTYIDETGAKLTSPELVVNMKPIEIPPEDKAVPNWDVLIRILENQEETTDIIPPVIPDDTSSTHSQTNQHILQRQISYDDKIKWRDIITTESTLRTMLTEAVVREDFERIRSDTRYETIFEPTTWDVIIRILAPPDDVELRAPRRNKKKEPWDTRSRRSSLPTLYEYDSDGGSSVRTIPQDMLPTGSANTYQYPPQSRRTSRSSFNAEHVDMRSMSEVIVDFGRPESDNVSDVSSFYPNRYYDDDPYDRRSIQRSLSQPSLARSATEITERWVIPDDVSEDSESPRNSNRLTTFQPRVRHPQHVITESQFVQQSSSTFQATSTTSPPKDWYGDNSK
ncbi:uncharacterized protein LOC116342887 isoform X2 [Contarinia nasturtii]|uniref:uncharacterized protein LOC116342887 isoform X2 n=1 Tax=Contarinia nasturtii TaxID=265458 RepID=UPI0012D3A7B3|nr:uncharacterized protein LOC116342887 isoform X2 [Contarinia nasturtii]